MTESSVPMEQRETTPVRSLVTWRRAHMISNNVIQTTARPEYVDWYELCAAGRTAEAAVRVAARVDRYLRNRDFPAIDTLLELLDVTKLGPAVVLGLVAWTKPAARELKARDQLVARVQQRLAEELGEGRAQSLLAPAR